MSPANHRRKASSAIELGDAGAGAAVGDVRAKTRGSNCQSINTAPLGSSFDTIPRGEANGALSSWDRTISPLFQRPGRVRETVHVRQLYSPPMAMARKERRTGGRTGFKWLGDRRESPGAGRPRHDP